MGILMDTGEVCQGDVGGEILVVGRGSVPRRGERLSYHADPLIFWR